MANTDDRQPQQVPSESNYDKARYKLVDWWLMAIAIYTTLMGIAVPVTGYFIISSEQEEVEEMVTNANEAYEKSQETLAKANEALAKANEAYEKLVGGEGKISKISERNKTAEERNKISEN